MSFTEEEKQYIKNNPIIKVQNENDWKPYNYNENGLPKGHSIDYMNLLASKIGLKIKYVHGYTWKQYLEKINSHELDVIVNIAKTPKREDFLIFTSKYNNILSSLYMINKDSNFKTLKDLDGKTISVVGGMIGESVLKKNYPKINIYPTKNSLDALKAVIYGKADGVIQANVVGAKLIEKYNFVTLKPIFEIHDPSFNMHLHIATSKKDKVLLTILEKGKSLITEKESRELTNKWFKTITNKIELTDEEKKYLFTKNKIDFCIDPNWYPFQKIENKKHVGMSADILKLFEKEIKIPFTLILTKNWTESLAFIKDKKCDILPLAMETEKRKEFLNFTDIYVDSSMVITTVTGEPFIKDISFLKNRKIAIIKEHPFIEVIKDKFPNIEIVKINNINEGLVLVEKKEVYGYVGSLASVSYQINKNYTGRLKVSSVLEEKFQLAIAINKDNQILTNIFNKLIDNIDKNEISAIVNKWSAVKVEKHIDYSIIYKIIAFFILLTSFILFWTFKLKKDKEKVNSLYEKLDIEKNKTDKLNLQLIQKELKLEDANRKLKVLSSTDTLTKIYNRRVLDEYLEREIIRSERTEEEFGLILIDIDYFKKVNDTFGHQVGDQVLISVTKIIQKCIRKVDTFGRWGGEEFLIISPTKNEQAMIVSAERIRKEIEKHIFEDVGKKTISLGITVYKKGDNPDSIIKRVDNALYEAKREGRNKVILV